MNKKVIKWGVALVILVIIAATVYAYYLYNKPHRDIQAANIDFEVSSTDLVNEFLNDPDNANDKYLQGKGGSQVLAVSGTLNSIDTDMKGQKVVILKSDDEKAGVSCTFRENTESNIDALKPGDQVTIKGIIRSGALYDEDFELYEDVILEQCDIYN